MAVLMLHCFRSDQLKKVSVFSLISKIPYTVIIKLRLPVAMAKPINSKLKFAELPPGFLTCGGRDFFTNTFQIFISTEF